MMKYVRILNDNEIVNDEVGLGSKVKLWDVEFEEKVGYSIVGTAEADPDNNKLSLELPVGNALLYHKTCDTVEAVTPGGVVEFKILVITR